MKYRYRYVTRSTFQPAVEWHFFKLRSVPCTNEFQRLLSSRLHIAPDCRVHHSSDGQGNAVQWGAIDVEHDEFCIESEGEVEQTGPYLLHEKPAGYYLVPTRLTDDVGHVELESLLTFGRESLSIFGHESLPTFEHESLLTFERESLPSFEHESLPTFELAAILMHMVHRRIAYTPCHTTTRTTASEVWADGRGVCQDYAHVMISLCRHFGLPARYVCGFIAGEGQTHAWVEVSDGQVWRGFDPTHDCMIEWGYVKLAHGRDADDCTVNRGRFYGWTLETMTSNVVLQTIVK